jgi:hypothetical protein
MLGPQLGKQWNRPAAPLKPFLSLRVERRLRMFQNRMLRRKFGPKRDEVTGEWGKLYNEELNEL